MNKQMPLSAERERLLALRLKGAGKRAAAAVQLPKRPPDQPAPLTFAQHQLWVIDQITPGNPAYNIPAAYRVRGALDPVLLESAFNQIAQRHEVWRTTFHEFEGDAVAQIHPECRIQISVTDLCHLPEESREREISALLAREADRPFDLTRLPLLRVSLFKAGDGDHVLLFNMHHIVGDGVSINLMFSELDAIYRGAISGVAPKLPALAIQYADFAFWQKTELQKSRYSGQLDYWRRQLAGNLPLLEFTNAPRAPQRRSFTGSSVNFSLPPPLVQAFNTVAAREGCTFFVAVLAAVQIVLTHYSGAEDFAIGMPIANRPLPEVDRSIGNFVNIVALRCDASGNPSFLDLLRRCQETVFGALSNKDIPLEMLVSELKSQPNPTHSPVFQFLLQTLPPDQARIGDLSLSPFDFELKSTQVDLALHLYEQANGGVLGRFQYCSELFSRDTIERLSRDFLQSLEEIGKDPQRRILEFPLSAHPTTPQTDEDAPASPDLAHQGVSPTRRSSLESQLIEIWEEVLHRSPIGISDDFFALGGYSLLVAKMLGMVEKRLGVRLPFGAFFAEATIERTAILIRDKQQRLAADVPWVALNKDAPKPPFFFLHGDYNGGGFFSRSLARYSGGDRPFYAIHPAGLHDDPIPATIEEMAEQKLRVLREIQPEGPYLLGGYCNGAMVAYEMACRIEAEGGTVPVVVMLVANGQNFYWRYLRRLVDATGELFFEDEAPRRQRFLRWRKDLNFLRSAKNYYVRAAANLVKQPLGEQARRIWRKSRKVFRRLCGKKPEAKTMNAIGERRRLEGIKIDAYSDAFSSYLPKRFGGRIVLLWPEDEKAEMPPTYGWTQVCDDVRLVTIPGEHANCVERDSILRVIGEQIGVALADIEARDKAPS